MRNRKAVTRMDAGAKNGKSKTISVILPNDKTASLHGTARLRKKLHKKRRKAKRPAADA